MEEDKAGGEEDRHPDIIESSQTDIEAKKLPQYLAAMAVNLGGLALGMVMGWSAPAIELIKKDIDIAENEISWIGSVTMLGGASVMFPMAFLLDRLGRKATMLALVLPFVAGWLTLTFFRLVPTYIAGRFITGVCGCAFSVTAPVYVAEIAQTEIRGRLGTFFQLMMVIGILLVYTIGYTGDLMVLSLLCACAPAAFAVVFFFMPETPEFLLTKGRPEQARASLQWLRGRQYDIEPEWSDLEELVENSERKDTSIKEVWRSRPARKGLLTSVGLMFCQQLSGMNIVIVYAVTIFSMADTDINANICAIILGLIQVASTMAAAVTVDLLGRRFLLIVSHATMGVCLLLVGVYFTVKENNKDSGESIWWLPLVAIGIYILAFSFGSGPLPWVMLGELLAPEVKGVAGSISACTNWTLAFLVTLTFPYMMRDLGPNITFWIYSVLCFMSAGFIMFFVIETKGKSLEQIQEELAS